MTDQIWWYATRAAGLMTWATAVASVILGLSMSLSAARATTPTGPLSRILRRVAPSNPWTLDVHRFVGGLSVSFLIIHMVTLWADSFVTFGWAELFVPFASEWRPLAVAFGVVSAWLLAAVELTSLLKKWMPDRLWHGVHLSAYLVAIFGTVHAVMSGSDVGNPIVAGIGFVMLAAVVGLTVIRVAILRRGTPDADTERREDMLEKARAARDGNDPTADDRAVDDRTAAPIAVQAKPRRAAPERQPALAGAAAQPASRTAHAQPGPAPRPAQTQPGQTQPAQTQPGQTQPAQTQPAPAPTPRQQPVSASAARPMPAHRNPGPGAATTVPHAPVPHARVPEALQAPGPRSLQAPVPDALLGRPTPGASAPASPQPRPAPTPDQSVERFLGSAPQTNPAAPAQHVTPAPAPNSSGSHGSAPNGSAPNGSGSHGSAANGSGDAAPAASGSLAERLAQAAQIRND